SLKERIDYYLELFSLAEWKDELIENYSHGMKQRLIITSVLIRDPEIIIVDEPMVGLDPIAVRMVKDIFRGLVKEGKTIF
ncbi:MAG: ATP-binding cassette domain-containing protein, partial [Desulfatiglandales bacterium]